MLKEIGRTISLLVVLAGIGSIPTDSPSQVLAQPPILLQPVLVGKATVEVGMILPTPTATATATETETRTLTPLPTKPPTKTRTPVIPTKTKTAPTAPNPTTRLELNNSADINLDLGASVTIPIGIKAGDNQIILKSDNPLTEKTLGVYGPEGSLVGSGNRCPKTVLQNHSDCQLFYRGGHWGQNGWQVKVINLSSQPLKATLQFEGSSAGVKNCYSYWENYQDGTLVFWTECER